MSELRPQFFHVLMSKFFYLCSFILSHPLYFSYFIFFSPYIIKLLSFLSPLFITTTLLLLALFTISPSLILHNNAKGLTRKDDELDVSEEFEAYKIVFGASIIDDQENSVEFLDCASAEESESPILDHDKYQSVTDKLGENSAEVECTTKHVIEEKTLENFFKEVDGFDKTSWSDNVEVKKVDKIIEKQEETLVRNVHTQGLGKNLENVGIGYGSMRKEKEWTRTLACKLFEERHNTSHSNSEGMDMLWETYETETKKNKAKRANNVKKKNKGELKRYEKEYDEDEQEMDDQQLCCLQALKFSAGKMNLGMGRPNLVKISKAFRGFGWLGKNNKKVHCGDGF
ncbi:uncharacterized protein LOC132051217 [Lycium ferocissimum]|uniref:uncharacterized protein LOC132051217 n=1 Tax=Lycium ferocissimum TaxID=112874 RepID=UPI002814D29A|nr:uncharacterized protein LOC132051217 [Lycium ferocissimum]